MSQPVPLCAGLQLEVSATADPAGSLIRISLTAANPAAQTAAAQLLGAALKGGLLGAEGGSALGPLLVVNMEGAAGLVAPLLRCMLYPRLVLYWAQLRQVREIIAVKGIWPMDSDFPLGPCFALDHNLLLISRATARSSTHP